MTIVELFITTIMQTLKALQHHNLIKVIIEHEDIYNMAFKGIIAN